MWIFSYQVIILMYQYQNKYYIVRKGDFAYIIFEIGVAYLTCFTLIE